MRAGETDIRRSIQRWRGTQLLVCFGVVSIAQPSHACLAQSLSRAAAATERVGRVQRDLAFLASPALEGREAGKPGADTAASFIANRFFELGLRAAFTVADCHAGGDCRPSYLQPFHTPEYVAFNVAAIIPGTDSTLRDQYVAITAHYDHIGRWSGGQSDHAPPNTIHPGADDNASGTVAIIELARRISEHPLPRPVMVIAFGAEEFGLVGSRVFVEHPPFELRNIKAVVNLDMIGRLRHNRLLVYGAAGSLRKIVEEANADARFSLSLARESSRRSDDFSFSSHGIPALHVSTGEHVDYHRATDTVDRIELGGMMRVIDYVERVVNALAR